MPFTLAHPAAAIPLRRALGRFGILPALILGSLAPDLTYFLPVSIERATTHTIDAVFWFCVPATTLAYVIYDRLLLGPIIFLLPASIRARLGPPLPHALTPHLMLAVCVSAAAGAFTHVAWDSFTHGSGAAVRALPALRVLVAEFGGYRLWTYKIVQHSSTIGGSLLLAYWSWRWFQSTPPIPTPPASPFPNVVRLSFIPASLFLSVLVGCVRAAQRASDIVSISTLQVFLKYAAVSFIATFVVLLIVLAIGWKLRSHIHDAKGRTS